jgi:nucleotide-binding universal stress UspA family protein
MEMPGIIVGVDGSHYSQRALEWGMNEAAIRHVPITVVTVYQPAARYWGSAASYPGDRAPAEHARTGRAQAERARRTAQEAADKALAGLGDDRPTSVTVKAVSGNPGEEILSAARDADMIVVGARGAGGFARLLMGSVSTHLTYHARCPVVVIPPDDRG